MADAPSKELEGSKNVVLIAMDESEHSAKALEWYVKELHKPNHQVHIVSTVQPPATRIVGMYSSAMLIPDLSAFKEDFDKKKKHLYGFLQTTLDQSHYKGMNIRTDVVDSGHPGEVIVQKSAELGASMVVMGTRGLGPLRRTLLGSVSDYVIHHANCPVIVHRPLEGEKPADK